MKRGLLCSLGLTLVVTAMLLVGGRSQEAPSQPPAPPPLPELETNTAAPPDMVSDQEPASADQGDVAALADAAVTPISTATAPPPNLKPTGALAEVVKLVNSGVDESVLMAYVTNSASPFGLGVEEIIYLNDLGVPGPVVTAMIQRDQALKGVASAAGPAAEEPAAAALTNQFAPQPAVPIAYAPQPEAPPPGAYPAEGEAPPPAEDTGYSTFYDSLSPYGTWVDVAGYGPCWQPTVVVINPTWRPYCNSGRWVYSDCGWYWQSGYSWGWAPFHYGRWFQHNRLGWCWAPGQVWGPSWVCWRYSGSYCGWAPLPPGAWYRAGAGLTWHGHQVNGSFGFGLSAKSYAFVGVNHFRDPHLNRHALSAPQAAQVYHTTSAAVTIAGSQQHVVNHGIPVARVAAATGTRIQPVTLRDAKAPVAPGARGDQVEGTSRTMPVYRPNFTPSGTTASAPAGRSSAKAGPQQIAHDPPLRTPGSTAATQPVGSKAPPSRVERPAPTSSAFAPVTTGSPRTITPPRSDPAPQSAAPQAQHGPERPVPAAGKSSVTSIGKPAPASAPVFVARTEPKTPTAVSAPPTSRPQTVQPRPTPVQPTSAPRALSTAPPTWRPTAPAASAAPVPSTPAPVVRSEPARPYTAPAAQAPPAAPRVAPAPTPAPPPARSYSPPPVVSAPRAPAMESRPAPAPAPARSSPAPASQGRSSSDKNGR